MSLPLLITDEEHVPMYLQIVHQIRYLITSRELAADQQLPSVRALASQLGVNTGTVAQAYRMLQAEGLIDSQQGRGSFVVPLPDVAGRFSTRQAHLTEHLDALVARAFAMGFDAAALRHHLNARLKAQVPTLPIVLIAPSRAAADKYAGPVSDALPAALFPTVIPCTLDELQAGDARVLAAYARTYFTVVAFMSNVPAVEEALRRHGVRSEVIGLTAHLSDETIARLKELDPGELHALVTEARNVNAALGLLSNHSSLDLPSVRILTELSGEHRLRDLREERVIHTFGVAELLDRCEIPAERRLELAFTLSADSYERLRRVALGPSIPAEA